MVSGQVIKQSSKEITQIHQLIYTAKNTAPARDYIPNRAQILPQENFLGVFTATGYTHTGHPTTSGVWPKRGIVSVDPLVIPLGTRLYIENYGEAVALDTGGDIKGNKLDLFFEIYGEAIQFGRRPVKVWIIP